LCGAEKIVSVEAWDKRKREEMAQNTTCLSQTKCWYERAHCWGKGEELVDSVVQKVTTTMYTHPPGFVIPVGRSSLLDRGHIHPTLGLRTLQLYLSTWI